MEINNIRNFTLAGIAAAVMLGCGGSGDSGTAGNTGITTVGALTGFGSVYVNGVEYETDEAEYEVEDEAAFDDSALKVGMVVKVKGSVNPDGRTGTRPGRAECARLCWRHPGSLGFRAAAVRCHLGERLSSECIFPRLPMGPGHCGRCLVLHLRRSAS